MAQRLAMRQPPRSTAVGRQRWNHLLFAHWEIEPGAIQATLPRGLFVDTFQGSAYLGIVPFFMERVRPSWLPPVPGLSWFLELNVRTYVHDAAGRPGVWFYSLDCNQPLAVAIARRFFHLPYFRADMDGTSHGATTSFHSRRRGEATAASNFAWTTASPSALANPGTLEFFLVERYLLFAANGQGRLFCGRVHHAPYRISTPAVSEWSSEPAREAGFKLAGAPASLLAAEPVDVIIYPLQPLDLAPDGGTADA